MYREDSSTSDLQEWLKELRVVLLAHRYGIGLDFALIHGSAAAPDDLFAERERVNRGDVDILLRVRRIVPPLLTALSDLVGSILYQGAPPRLELRHGPVPPGGEGGQLCVHLVVHDRRSFSDLSPATKFMLAVGSRPLVGRLPPWRRPSGGDNALLARDLGLVEESLARQALLIAAWSESQAHRLERLWFPATSPAAREKLLVRAQATLRTWALLVGGGELAGELVACAEALRPGCTEPALARIRRMKAWM